MGPKQRRIEELERRVVVLEEQNDKLLNLNIDLKEQIQDRLYPTEEALEDLESHILKATKLFMDTVSGKKPKQNPVRS